MNAADRSETVAILGRILDAISATITDRTGSNAAGLRSAIGGLRANAAAYVEANAAGAPLLNCFALALAAGASLDAFARARVAIQGEAPVSVPAVALVNGAVVMALAHEARIVADTDFVSRDDVDRVLARMDAAFDDAELKAADELATTAYRTIVAMHAAVVNDLTARARPLPRVVNYSFPVSRPALWLANLLYGDGSRAVELIDENKPVHPAFMPSAVRALSS